jgi:hypothetical protein
MLCLPFLDVMYYIIIISTACAPLFAACPVFYLMNLKAIWSVCVGYSTVSLGLALYASCLPVVMVNQVRLCHLPLVGVHV